MSRYPEVLAILQKYNPSIQFFTNPEHNAIGYWNHTLGRGQVLVSELLDGSWASRSSDLEINGEPVIQVWEPCRADEILENI